MNLTQAVAGSTIHLVLLVGTCDRLETTQIAVVVGGAGGVVRIRGPHGTQRVDGTEGQGSGPGTASRISPGHGSNIVVQAATLVCGGARGDRPVLGGFYGRKLCPGREARLFL
jgi:hypothetical protein